MLLSAEHLSINFGSRQLLEDVNFYLNEGDKVGVIGINGTGKSSFLRVLAGQQVPDSGTVSRDPNVQVCFLSQNPKMDPEATVLEQVFSDFSPDTRALMEYEAKAMLTRLGITDFAQPVGTLSGGQRKRVALAAVLLHPADVLILDEPTNHLDLDSREWIEEAVEEYEGALLFVSHDRYFIDRFATRIWTLENGVVTDFKGDYAAYQAWRERQKQLAPPPKPQKEEKVKKEKPKRTGGTKQLKKDLAAAEKRMEKLDQLMETLNAEKEAAASDYQKLQELAEQEAEYTAEYDALMEKWEVLSEAIAAEEG